MGINDDIAKIRGDSGAHAQNLFIEFLLRHPENSGVFPDYVGKTAAELKAQAKFSSHTKKVLDLLLDIVESIGDAGKTAKNADRLAKMQQHASLNSGQFQALFNVLVPYLQGALGANVSAAEWRKAGITLVAALRNAGMR